MRALCKEKKKRYQSAAEMAADLRKALGMPDGGFVKQKKPAKPSKPRKRSESRPRREAPKQDARQRRAGMKRRIMYSLAGVLIACALFVMLMAVWFMNHIRRCSFGKIQ
jgi:hypothetical protein